MGVSEKRVSRLSIRNGVCQSTSVCVFCPNQLNAFSLCIDALHTHQCPQSRIHRWTAHSKYQLHQLPSNFIQYSFQHGSRFIADGQGYVPTSLELPSLSSTPRLSLSLFHALQSLLFLGQRRLQLPTSIMLLPALFLQLLDLGHEQTLSKPLRSQFSHQGQPC